MRLAWIALIALTPASAEAFLENLKKPKDLSITVEPVVGVETEKQLHPEPHVTVRVFYGARFIVGYGKVAGEGEVTRSNSESFFPLYELRIKETIDRGRIGLRYRIPVLQNPVGLSGHVRGGGQAERKTREEIQFGIGRTIVEKIEYRPYVGAGLSIFLMDAVALTLDGTVAVNVNDPERSQFQGSAALSFSF